MRNNVPAAEGEELHFWGIEAVGKTSFDQVAVSASHLDVSQAQPTSPRFVILQLSWNLLLVQGLSVISHFNLPSARHKGYARHRMRSMGS